MHPDFVFFENYLRDTYGLLCSEKQEASESAEYGAATCYITTKKIIFRTAKTTPSKTGQFVTIWKRDEQGSTEPFDVTDAFDYIIIITRSIQKTGLFIFSKSILSQNGIISGNRRAGKRGIRVYPPWDKPTNKQAQQTQTWQQQYFIDCSQRIKREKQGLEKLILY